MKIFKKQYSENPRRQYVAVLKDLGLNAYEKHQFEVIVDEGFDSPYQFGVDLRNAVQDEFAPIYRTSGVYWCVSGAGMVSFCKSPTIGVASIPSDAVPV